MNQNIENIVKEDLCTGCGTCAGVCPSEAIEMKINRNGIFVGLVTGSCTHCGNCLKVCPGRSVDFKKLNTAIFGKKPQNQLIGNLLGCYTGQATAADVRQNGSSGGLVTSLLLLALEEGLIDGAIVVKMDENNPTEPKVIVARTPDQIASAQTSKYCPVPANIALREILSIEGKYAVVGVPCHIHGIRKAEIVNKTLKRRIVLHFGLFCSHTVSFKGTGYLLRQIGVGKDEVKSIRYRGGGWPGVMMIKLKNGETKEIPYHSYRNGLFNLFFFTPQRCLSCVDMTCELADLSFGDAWLPEFIGNQMGASVVIARHDIGKKLLDLAIVKRKITLKEISSSRLLQQHANHNTMRFKKAIRARFLPFLMLHKQTPIYSMTFSRSKSTDFFVSMLSHFNSYVSMNQKLWKAIPVMCTIIKLTTGALHK